MKVLRIFAVIFLALNLNLFVSTISYADDPSQAVVDALANAATQVQEAVDASNSAAQSIDTATAAAQTANQMAPVIIGLVDSATIAVTNVDGATASVLAQSTLETSTVVQSSPVVVQATNAVATAQQTVQILDSAIATAQTLIQQAASARTAVDSATANANTQFMQANQAIAQAQSAVNTLQATISTVRSVLSNTDDAGVLMTLPFSMLMGNTLYSNVYLGSNAVITFGTNQGNYYWTTPTVPEVSVGGFDWTTWSQGSGITYSTTPTTLSIAWDVRVFPTTDHSIQMTQLRFDANVNPTTGAWIADVSGVGPWVDQARWNYRQTTNGTIRQIVDSNPVSNQFNGSLGQGTYTPVVVAVDTNTALVQSQIDSATETIRVLNVTVSGVVTQNAANASAVSSIPSTSSANSAVRIGTSASDSLTTQLQIKADTLTAIIAILPTTQSLSESPTAQEPQTSPQPQPSTPSDSSGSNMVVVYRPDYFVGPIPQSPEQPPFQDAQSSQPPLPPIDGSSSNGPTAQPLPSTGNTQPAPKPQGGQQNSNGTSSGQSGIVQPNQPGPNQNPGAQNGQTSSQGNNKPGQQLIPNNPTSLPTDKPVLPQANQLVAKPQVDKPGVENGGQQFFGTQQQPQVIGENGKLTPPPPAPGSGAPIPPGAVTIPETFIGQPGGMIFNAPDVAVPVDTITVGVDIPGAQALADMYVNLANVGNDMSPVTRQKAKKILVATLVAGQIVQFRKRF